MSKLLNELESTLSENGVKLSENQEQLLNDIEFVVLKEGFDYSDFDPKTQKVLNRFILPNRDDLTEVLNQIKKGYFILSYKIKATDIINSDEGILEMSLDKNNEFNLEFMVV